MSYMRDSDRRTRGVGAIAAADNVSGARRMRQAQIHHATRIRDRQMSAIARGALGLVPIGPGNPLHWSEDRDTTYVAPPTPAAPTKMPPTMYIPPPIPVNQPPAATIPPAVISPPAGSAPPVTTVTAPPAGSGTVIVTGGGSGSGVTLGTQPVAPPIAVLQPPPLPDIPDGAATDHTARNIAIAGGVALAAYLLFRKRSP